MTRKLKITTLFLLCALGLIAVSIKSPKVAADQKDDGQMQSSNADSRSSNEALIKEGRHTFRYDTFGDQDYWGNTLKLHQVIEGAKFGGVGPGVSPKTALAVGLKVDVDALPSSLVAQLKAGRVNLDDPATTLALLKLDAVVGVTGFFDRQGGLRSMGIQCALCHSTVDNSLLRESVIGSMGGLTGI